MKVWSLSNLDQSQHWLHGLWLASRGRCPEKPWNILFVACKFTALKNTGNGVVACVGNAGKVAPWWPLSPNGYCKHLFGSVTLLIQLPVLLALLLLSSGAVQAPMLLMGSSGWENAGCTCSTGSWLWSLLLPITFLCLPLGLPAPLSWRCAEKLPCFQSNFTGKRGWLTVYLMDIKIGIFIF